VVQELQIGGTSVSVERLRRRADFLKAATGSKAPAAPFVLQARERGGDTSVRIGFTVSRKVGSAVERNRVRRRLREVVKRSAAQLRPGYDYVVVARRAALQEPFDRMVAAFDAAVRRVHAARTTGALSPTLSSPASGGGTKGGAKRRQ
jgi:ribonuclease P protein component